MSDERKSIQYLGFTLANQVYGIAIDDVREISQVQEITPVPRVPDYVVGVMNLRGKVLPMIDLRKRFELPDLAYNRETCAIIIEGKAGEVGIVVDKVNEVINTTPAEIQAAPSLGSEAFVKFVVGMLRRDNELIMLVGARYILSFQEYANLPKSEAA